MRTAATIPEDDASSAFVVSPWMDFLSGLVHRHPKFWLGLGRIESYSLADALRSIAVRMPIYVCGLARSGSTILHEVLCSSSCAATHRVKDYPMVFTPFWWRRAAAKAPVRPPRPRAHGDGMTIALDSPDALEEMLWLAFFPSCHDPDVSMRMEASDHYPAFESFHDNHLRKLLLAEAKTRYVAKANYHVARLPYLARLYPDVKFVVPVRAPESHIASLLRQQRRFSQGQRRHPRSLAYMQRSGHFEFGRDRRPMNLGDGDRVAQVRRAWAAGDEVRGLAMVWDMVYAHLARVLASEERVRSASCVVRYESLCAEPTTTLRTVLDHCRIPDVDNIVERHAPTIRYPDYYRSDFSAEDRAAIREETALTASLWGY